MMIKIKNIRIVNPAQKLDSIKDITIQNGVIKDIAETSNKFDDCNQVIDGTGCLLMPGLFDRHVHLREPGYEYKEDIASGTKAAARGGVTGLLAMPNTKPTVESADVVKDIIKRIVNKAHVQVMLTGSITKGLKGESLSDIKQMITAGIIAITDDGRTTMSEPLMRQAYTIIKDYDIPLISHSEDHDIVGDGAVHEGAVSKALGISGIAPEVESNIVKRDIRLVKETGAKLHIAHISAIESIDAVRKAQAEGLSVTAEACPHHFILTDEILRVAGTLAKVNPPIRSEEHRMAVEDGLLDGTISSIVTDHAPHTLEEKAQGFAKAPFGISGVELSLSLSYTHFVKSGKMSIAQLITLMAINPRTELNLQVPRIQVGEMANLLLFDPRIKRKIKAEEMLSKGTNIPYEGMNVYGDVLLTMYNGKIVWQKQ